MRRAIMAATGLLAVTCLVDAQGPASQPVALTGIYQTVADEVVLPGGLRNSGSPDRIELLPAAVERVKTVNFADDPARLCQPLGPFRMMARAQTKVEFVPSRGTLVMLFEDLAHGLVRTVHFNRPHPPMPAPLWHGDSVGRWEGGTLVIDTIAFNDRIWLNDAGVQGSDALHLVERLRPLAEGRYLEYVVTADDPRVLAKPYSYRRYFERAGDVVENVCEF